MVTSSHDPERRIPATVTAGQLAQAVGVSERTIMARKMDGRLPTAPDGRIDLTAIIRAGVNALGRRPGMVALELDRAEVDDALRTAAQATAHLMLTRFLAAKPGADLGMVAGEALREALDLFGLVETGEVPIPERLKPLKVVV